MRCCKFHNKEATTSESVPLDMFIQRRLDSACTSVQSDQSTLSASLAIQNVPSKGFDQTAWMCRLSWIFAWCTCPHVLTWLICFLGELFIGWKKKHLIQTYAFSLQELVDFRQVVMEENEELKNKMSRLKEKKRELENKLNSVERDNMNLQNQTRSLENKVMNA